jgi:thymidylate synthase ThyX
MTYVHEDFTADERATLTPFFSDLDGPVFALTNMPEAVKGALFARYSRTTKSLRRLFLDEFASEIVEGAEGPTVATARAAGLYERIFVEYGDDSVAQLGGVHLACEQSSQLLAKALEWGRLAAYLEQSTRYMRYDDKPGGAWRATVPAELEGTPLADRFQACLDELFTIYGRLYEPVDAYWRARIAQGEGDSDFIYRQSIMAKTCDTLRVLLPAATRSNLGIFASGQSYEQLLMRLAVHPLAEMREYGGLMLTELRKVIPEFLTRVDVPDRGAAWSRYWKDVREHTQDLTTKLVGDVEPGAREQVTLTEHDPEGEVKVIAAILYAGSRLPDDQLLDIARGMSDEDRAAVLAASIGERRNRRHKPGRAWERTGYRFDIVCDFGAFRDLQRHRPLTIEWQRLTPSLGYDVPAEIEEAGLAEDWHRAMEVSRSTWEAIEAAGLPDVAQYAVSMAYKIRFSMQMTAREAMHLTELRSQPTGHPVYRRVAHAMHREIERVHPAIGAAFSYVSYEDVDLERLEAERRAEARRKAIPERS